MSETHEKPPPAGGFGAGPGLLGVEHQPHEPRQRLALPIGLAVGILAVGVTIGVSCYEHERHRREVSAEAMNTVGEIGERVRRSYEETGVLCPSARAVPADFSAVKAGAYEAMSTGDYATDPGWRCLGFEVEGRQHYQYRYERVGDVFFTVTAVGDLDGNDVRSTFTLDGHVDAKAVVVGPTIQTTNPGE